MNLVVEKSRILGKADASYNACLAASLGSALGRTVGSGNVIVTGRDGKTFSRLMKRALTCGIMENGIQVLDTRLVPAPVMRYCIPESASDYGLYFSFYWRDQTSLAATIYDDRGALLDEELVRKVHESLGQGERNVSASEVGDIMFYAEARASYAESVLRSVDTKSISKAKPTVFLDCANGAVSVTLPEMLRKLDCRVVSTHDDPSAHLTTKPTMSEASLLDELAERVRSGGGDLGIALDPCGESARFVDDAGEVIPQLEVGLLLARHLEAGTVLLQAAEPSEIQRFREMGTRVASFAPAYERIFPKTIDIALGEDETFYIRDETRRWWDAVPAAMEMVELASGGSVSGQRRELGPV
jgi:phosphomannomutase